LTSFSAFLTAFDSGFIMGGTLAQNICIAQDKVTLRNTTHCVIDSRPPIGHRNGMLNTTMLSEAEQTWVRVLVQELYSPIRWWLATAPRMLLRRFTSRKDSPDAHDQDR